MAELAFQFFPFPHVLRGNRRPGSLVDWPDRCHSCDRHCELSNENEIGLCSYGLNYYRVDHDLLITGIVLRDFAIDTPARRKMYAQLRHQLVSLKQLKDIIQLSRHGTARIEADFEQRMEEVVQKYRQSRYYYDEILTGLQPEIERVMAQVHDYKQFVQQIFHNLDVILESRFPNSSLLEKVERAEHEEAAIYWSAFMMNEKLDAVAYLQSPDRILEVTERGRFQLHEQVERYVRIYQRLADQREITVKVGNSAAETEGNIRALGFIPHTLIDNAVKYAPSGTRIEIDFFEDMDQVHLSVASFGPKISEPELLTIFDPFVRGVAAQCMRVEGAGFGLAAAQVIAVAHGTRIEVRQSAEEGPDDTFMTTFTVGFERRR